jgi:hypothetical protein
VIDGEYRVYLIRTSAMLMVFDRDGKQVPSLQGPVETTAEKVLKVVPEEYWHVCDYRALS